LGETEEELFQAMRDLRASNCDILTLGQYLQPSLKHLPVIEFVTPGKFAEYKVGAPRRWVLSMSRAGRWCAARITRMNFLCR
jgi:lipoate synthase